MNVQRILFPTDFSPSSEVALDHALHQAEIHDAELHIVHGIVWNDQDKLSVARFPDADNIMLHMQKVAKVHLEETMTTHRDKPFKIFEKSLVGARPAETILNYADEIDADMIIMGTHGRQGLYYFLMGSVAEEIVRLAHCPVITISETGERSNLRAVRKIMVPVDFSDASRRALARARHMADLHKAELLVMHVIQKLDFPVTGPEAGFTFLKDWLPKIKAENEAHLEQILQDTVGPAVPFKTIIDVGNPARDIIEAVKTYEVDYIVMPTHGRTGFDRMLMGSTAERVIRTAPCPVYTDKFND